MPRDDRTFITVHDGMPEHDKIEGLSDAAFRLLISTWCWCSRNRTDGKVKQASWIKRGPARARKELIDAGLATVTDYGVDMHDYLEHQRSAAEIDELSQKRSEAGKKGGKARANALASAKQVPDGSTAETRSRSGNGGDVSTSRDSTNDVSTNPTQPSKHGESPLAKAKQTRSKAVAETETDTELQLTTSVGSRNVPAGFVPQVVRAYVESAKDADMPAPADSQAKVDRSARKLLAEGYELATVVETARNAAVNGWTDLATQLQRDAARAQPPPGARPSTTDQRAQAALALADHLDRKAIG